jgi:hypothetical protein
MPAANDQFPPSLPMAFAVAAGSELVHQVAGKSGTADIQPSQMLRDGRMTGLVLLQRGIGRTAGQGRT